MKKICITLFLFFSTMSAFAQIHGDWVIDTYKIESTKNIDNELNFSVFKAFIENHETLTFEKDGNIIAESLRGFYNPRYVIKDKEFTFNFGESKDKESFSRFKIKMYGNKFVLTKETPALKEKYVFIRK